MIEFASGNLFDINVDIRVNTVNCVGVMGAGVALAFKQRYPEMFRDYQLACKQGLVQPGKLHEWRSLEGDWVINFPTKRHWREPSRYEDIESGLEALRAYLEEVGNVSVALPALGCGNGGLDWAIVSEMISNKLQGLNAHVHVFGPSASNGKKKAGEGIAESERAELYHRGYQLLSEYWGQAANIIFPDGASISRTAYTLAPEDWITVATSSEPGAKEWSAIEAIADQMGKHETPWIVGALYQNKQSERLAKVFSDRGIPVVLVSAFGPLSKAKPPTFVSSEIGRSITNVSATSPSSKWSRSNLASATRLLKQCSKALLVFDPAPTWLWNAGNNYWRDTPMFYVRYETQSEDQIRSYNLLGATKIGRRANTGEPNITPLAFENKAFNGDNAQHIETASILLESPSYDLVSSILLAARQGTLNIKGMEITGSAETLSKLGVNTKPKLPS